jgi:hypothetical protein
MTSNSFRLQFFSAVIIGSFVVAYGCSNKENTSPPDACAGKTITVTATATQSADACGTKGMVMVTANGSSGFTYKIDAGSFQAGADFSEVAAGDHTITVKDAGGCEKTATVNVPTNSTPGPKFAEVKALIAAKCANPNCHAGAKQPLLTTNCNIVASADLIKTRAVDAKTMPPSGALPTADQDKISAWITAGKKLTD